MLNKINKDDYLYIGNGSTELEVGNFDKYNMRLKSSKDIPFFKRLAKLFLKETNVDFKIEFGNEELKNLADIFRKLYIKSLDNKKLTFNVEKTIDFAIIPTKAHSTDVGYDLYSPFEIDLLPGQTKTVNFHIKIGLEPGYEAQVRNRSGIVTNHNVMIPIGVGTIDPDYKGEILAPFFNFGKKKQIFKAGSRMAQLVIKKTEEVYISEGKVYNKGERGEGGFGSTGV